MQWKEHWEVANFAEICLEADLCFFQLLHSHRAQKLPGNGIWELLHEEDFQLQKSPLGNGCVYLPHPKYLGHLLLPLCLGGLCVCVVVCLNDNQVVALWVNDKLSGCVLQREGNLVEDCPQLLQCQNPGGQRCDMSNKVRKQLPKRTWLELSFTSVKLAGTGDKQHLSQAREQLENGSKGEGKTSS